MAPSVVFRRGGGAKRFQHRDARESIASLLHLLTTRGDTSSSDIENNISLKGKESATCRASGFNPVRKPSRLELPTLLAVNWCRFRRDGHMFAIQVTALKSVCGDPAVSENPAVFSQLGLWHMLPMKPLNLLCILSSLHSHCKIR